MTYLKIRKKKVTLSFNMWKSKKDGEHMGVFDKIKNLFTEEEEVEVPIKKEVKHVEITSPKREVVKEEVKEIKEVRHEIPREKEEIKRETVTDSVALNREEKFKFPVYFTDEDFEDLPKKEEIKKPEVKKVEPVKSEPYKPIIEEKKNFKPSPIISPVYGVLDKNYKKDDISSKKERPIRRHLSDEKLTVDDVRNKAYGTLEDDLENALLTDDTMLIEPETKPEMDIFEELEHVTPKREAVNLMTQDLKEDTVDLSMELEKQKQKIEEINAYIKQNANVKSEEVEQTVELQAKELPTNYEEETIELEPEQIKEENVDLDATLDNGDLFNLIDSMYEKREEE
jgi:hypothetical protein